MESYTLTHIAGNNSFHLLETCTAKTPMAHFRELWEGHAETRRKNKNSLKTTSEIDIATRKQAKGIYAYMFMLQCVRTNATDVLVISSFLLSGNLRPSLLLVLHLGVCFCIGPFDQAYCDYNRESWASINNMLLELEIAHD